MRAGGRKAWLMGLGTGTFEHLTEARADRRGIPLEKFREDFWAGCKPVAIEIVQDEEPA